MNTHNELLQVAHELADERNALAPVVAGFAGSWRGQLEARDRLIEQLGEALERKPPQWKLNEILAAYREWKEGQ